MEFETSCQACIISSLNGDYEACNVLSHCRFAIWAMTSACLHMVCWILDFIKFRRAENRFDSSGFCAAFCFQTDHQVFTKKRVDYLQVLIKISSCHVQLSCFFLKQTNKSKKHYHWTEKALISSLSLLFVAKDIIQSKARRITRDNLRSLLLEQRERSSMLGDHMSWFHNIFIVLLVNGNAKLREENLCDVPWCYSHLTQMVLKDGRLTAKLVTVYMLSPKSECEMLAMKRREKHYLAGFQKMYQPLVQSRCLSVKINFLYKFMSVYFPNCRIDGILPSNHKGAEENSTISHSFMPFWAGLSHLNWRKKAKEVFVWLVVFFNNFKTLIDVLRPGNSFLLLASPGLYVIFCENWHPRSLPAELRRNHEKGFMREEMRRKGKS